MSNESWQRLWDIFHEALEQAPDARSAFLDAACADDADLRQQVMRLLASHKRSSGVLDAKGADTALETADLSDPMAGERIGPYLLLEVLGEGGMGVVYTAQQERPVRRRVALKLIRLGMDSKEVIARFESERQALAIMDHPRIAKIFDAGTTETGRPYFVMEYVPGIPITEYCDLRGLGLRERLELFAQACEAIDHAHGKGIIHRDIKPSNLLVAAVDRKPSLKVIDFGVAKATNQRLTERTLFTQQGTLVGTPAYMSPEQAGTSPLEVDARTDIYALGVLLYELLVGALPFDPKTFRNVAMVEMLRIIQDEDPPTPAARITSLGDAAEEVAKRRHLDARSLVSQVRGELEWITMRAIEKDPGRRYTSAAEFASDIGRFLKNEPVVAGPPTIAYRLSKFIRRHRVGMATAAAFSILAIGLGAALTVQSSRFTRALEQTMQSAEKALPTPRLIDKEAGNFNTALPTADGRHMLRFNTERRGYELIDIESQVSTPLTSEGPDPRQTLFVNHALSPDSRWIAAALFLSAEADQPPGFDNDGGRELRMFEAGGRGEGRLIHKWGPNHYLQIFGWSPDQRRVWLFVIRPDRAAEIASIDVATGSIQVLKTLAWRSHTQTPSLSPDGRFIAYHDADSREAPPDVFLLPTDGSDEVRVEHPASDSKPIFAPDGSGIVFQSRRREGLKDLWFQPVVNGRPDGPPRIVWKDVGLYGTVKRFAENGSLFYFFATNAWEIYTSDLDLATPAIGRPERVDRRPDEMNSAPAFSPDGRFVAHLRGDRRLVIRELASDREREFPVPWLLIGATTVDWCADGASVILTGYQSEAVAFHVDLERGGAERLPLAKPSAVQCLGNGDEVLYLRQAKPGDGHSDTTHIVRRSLSTGAETVLYKGSLDMLRRSPDGTRIAFVEKDESEGRLCVMPSSGGEPVTIATSPVFQWMSRYPTEFKGVMWSPDGSAMLVVRRDSNTTLDETSPKVTLWRVPLDGGAEVELGQMSLPTFERAYLGAFNYSLHPDGSLMAFQRHAGLLAQVWAIDNLLPFIQSGASVPLAAPHP